MPSPSAYCEEDVVKMFVNSKSLRLLATAAAACIVVPFTQAQVQPPIVAPSYVEKVLYAFTGGSDGYQPSTLVRNANGNLYGTTSFGGSLSGGCGPGYLYDGCGVVFEINAQGQFSVVHTFEFSDGANAAIRVQDSNGDLYGTTTWGGNTACQRTGCGVIFKLTTAGDFTVLYSFSGGSDGANPNSLVMDSSGNFYGTTVTSNAGDGEIFELTKSSVLKVLYRFTKQNNGVIPEGVIRDSKGNLYGTSFQGGDMSCALPGGSGCGVVYKLDTSGKETVLYRFKGKSDGGYPTSPPAMDKAGNIYGTASLGGYEKGNCDIPNSPVGCGTVFKINTTGTFSALVDFNSADGDDPGPLTESASGNFYGATSFGGNGCSAGAGCGVVYKLVAGGKERVLYNFKGQTDGNNPGRVIADSTGNVYGVALDGGDLSCTPGQGSGCGVVFELMP
jgi:uncharacterized repeat protein (TIGR03803 family)